MLGLPKIAVARLKARRGVLQAAYGSAESSAFQGTDHPDANLLSAFVENALCEKERGHVLEHLIACGACREVAALCASAEGVDAEPARLAARRGTTRLVLRWGALTALVGTLAVVLVLYPVVWTRRVQLAQRTQRPAPLHNIPSAQTPIIEPSATPPFADLSAIKAKSGVLESVPRGKSVPRPPPENDELAAQTQILQRPAAASRPAAAMTSTRLLGMSRKETRGMSTTGASLPLPLPSPPPAGEPMAAAGASASLRTERPSRSDNLSASNSRGGGGQANNELASGSNSAKPAARATFQMMAQAQPGAFNNAAHRLEIAVAPAMTLWNVSADGNVQRLKSGGAAWERVHVAGGVAFWAVAALGNDIWAGGSGGALFHSTNAGATWARVDINVQGDTVTETITGLQASDATHITVKTASGLEWISGDGGRHWLKKT